MQGLSQVLMLPVWLLRRDRDQSHSQKAGSLARHSWAGEYSSSGSARVHVLHCIEEQKWHEGKPATLRLNTSWFTPPAWL